MFLDCRPQGYLGCIAKQVFDDRATLGGLLYLKQRLTGNPAVGNGLVPRLALLALTHDYLETVVTQVECLPGALNAISDDRYGLVLQYFSRFFKCKLVAGDHFLVNTAKIQNCHSYFNL